MEPIKGGVSNLPLSTNVSLEKPGKGGLGNSDLFSVTDNKKLGKTEKIKKLAKEFESIYMSQLLKAMRSTIHKEGIISGGMAEDIFTGMLDEQFAREMAYSQKGGLSQAIVEQLTKIENRLAKQTAKPDQKSVKGDD